MNVSLEGLKDLGYGFIAAVASIGAYVTNATKLDKDVFGKYKDTVSKQFADGDVKFMELKKDIQHTRESMEDKFDTITRRITAHYATNDMNYLKILEKLEGLKK